MRVSENHIHRKERLWKGVRGFGGGGGKRTLRDSGEELVVS